MVFWVASICFGLLWLGLLIKEKPTKMTFNKASGKALDQGLIHLLIKEKPTKMTFNKALDQGLIHLLVAVFLIKLFHHGVHLIKLLHTNAMSGKALDQGLIHLLVAVFLIKLSHTNAIMAFIWFAHLVCSFDKAFAHLVCSFDKAFPHKCHNWSHTGTIWGRSYLGCFNLLWLNIWGR